MKEEISNILQKVLNELDIDLKPEEIQTLIEVPPSSEMGDFAFPCFSLAGKLKMSPQEVAINLREKIGNPSKQFQDIQTSGPYINFFLNRKSLAINLIDNILKQKDSYGKIKLAKPVKTMIEFAQPNTNKPLHIGHLRNMSIGESVSRISEFVGEKVIRANLYNDRGIHICKSMWAYQKFGKNKTPKSEKLKSDHFVGKYYVLYGQKEKQKPEIETEAHAMLRKWEQGDKATLELWKKMNKWAFDGFAETFKKYNINFDKDYYESELYKKGKEIVEEGLKKGLFEKRKDGAVIINLKKEGLDEKVLLRIDGTSVYITQDLYGAKLKFEQYNLDKSYYVVANEQDYHFKVLFIILKKLGFEQNMQHISYGMVRLPEGKIKSREGTEGITADEILEKIQELVKKELNKRYKLSKKELETRSLKISLAAVKYALLKVDAKKNMIFDPKESVAIEGDTGPYVQYSYARANSILKKAKKSKALYEIVELRNSELELIKTLNNFREIVSKAHQSLNPSLIANYSYQLAQLFNEFYHDAPVIGSEQETFRLKLVEAFKQVLKNSLYLIGIDVLDEM